MTEATPRPLRSVLVANRGEIAVRVMTTARRLGYRTVAIASEADRHALHTRHADRVVTVGPPAPESSYLSIERIIDAALRSGADAVHPGYGFLSENAAFARACADAGLVFVGPTPEAIDRMGNKAAARRLMSEAGVPCVPGYDGEDQRDEALLAAAREIGLPLMVKAAAGGGGRGMRLVHEDDELADALRRARSESLSAFGSEELILERAVPAPRHVEIQVLADAHGHCIHLGERDCSVQRRHQKVIEESPSPAVDGELRRAMGEAAVKAARSVGYRNAGTVEFLLDPAGAFYFLEMNTRLQVEHPVTEAVTGLDLVELQFHVAEGRPLPLRQEDVALRGHAIEARLYAEDPGNDFLPQSGRLHVVRWSELARSDAGIATGSDMQPFYDPMLAKIVAHGATREDARRRLVSALEETVVLGPVTNRDFLLDCLTHPVFQAGAATTSFLAEAFGDTWRPQGLSSEHLALAAVVQFLLQREEALDSSLLRDRALLDWSSGRSLGTTYGWELDGDPVDLTVLPMSGGRYQVIGTAAEATEPSLLWTVELDRVDGLEPTAGPRVVHLRGTLHPDSPDGEPRPTGVTGHLAPGTPTPVLHVAFEALASPDGERRRPRVGRLVDRHALQGGGAAEGGGGRVTAPMHGLVVEVHVELGQTVEPGETVAVLEAMKMQHEIRSTVAGEILEILVRPDTQVGDGDLLVLITPAT